MSVRQSAANARSSISTFIGAVEDEWQLYSDNPDDYSVGSPIGFGASSTVYFATYRPYSKRARQLSLPPTASPPSSHIQCALKVVDLDTLPLKSLQLLKRETQLMSLSKHPNVLRVRGTWMTGHKLFIAMRLMKSGSVADVMRYGYPGGLEEDVCRCVLKQALEGLSYLHINGFIHRDLKAANLLIDDDGTVLLGDLGVAVSLADEEAPLTHPTRRTTNTEKGTIKPRSSNPAGAALQLGKRRSFVGTPCWMAPEVVSQKQYDSKADIWSFGITALELTLGRAPRSREPPHKVLMKTLNEEPPAIDREGGPFKYSRAFGEMIAMCLVKDPAQRPTAQQLLQCSFFKNTKRKSYLVNSILRGLPPLVDRQERRRQSTAPGALSVESWDFNSTASPSSPTSPHLRLKGVFPGVYPESGFIDGDLDEPHVRAVMPVNSGYESQQPSSPEFAPSSFSSSAMGLSDTFKTPSSTSSELDNDSLPPSRASTDYSGLSESPPNPITPPNMGSLKTGGVWKKLTASRKNSTSELTLVRPPGSRKQSNSKGFGDRLGLMLDRPASRGR